MSTHNRTNKSMNKTLRFAVAALAVLLVCGVFCGAAAADTWDSITTWDASAGDITYTIDSQDTHLIAKGDITVKGTVTLDFQNHEYTVKNDEKSGTDNIGGLINKIIFSGTDPKLIIKNLKIISGTVSGKNFVGGVVGSVSGEFGAGTLEFVDCTISGVTVTGDTNTNDDKYGKVGGLVGHVTLGAKLNFENCTLSGGSVTGSKGVGGLVGSANNIEGKNPHSYVTAKKCLIKDVSVFGTNDVGGLVGNVGTEGNIDAENCTVENCYIKAADSSVGGLVGGADINSIKVMFSFCNVANCVLYAPTGGYCGGVVGYSRIASSEPSRIYQNNAITNCLIYAEKGNVGGIIGGYYDSPLNPPQTCTDNTVEFCTVANQGTGNAGGIAGKFPSGGTMADNKVYYTCVVSKNGKAAGICPNFV